jgi:Na+/H+ antiporter NhaD/arsenite permease-like protein
MPVALAAARRHGLSSGRVCVAVAITANAASFLLPTSNITSLLLLGRTSLSALAYLRGSWLAWLLVVAVTVGPLTGWMAPAGTSPAPGSSAGPSGRAALDLIPLFAAASAIRAILAAGITLRGGLTAQLTTGTAVACVLNNLPAAAALHPVGPAGLWTAILATAIGPGLLLTGSIATLICRRIARGAGAALSAWQLTATGAVLVPAHLAAAVIGLHLTGALH